MMPRAIVVKDPPGYRRRPDGYFELGMGGWKPSVPSFRPPAVVQNIVKAAPAIVQAVVAKAAPPVVAKVTARLVPGQKQPAVQAGAAGTEYQDEKGNVITEAQYNAIIAANAKAEKDAADKAAADKAAADKAAADKAAADKAAADRAELERQLKAAPPVQAFATNLMQQQAQQQEPSYYPTSYQSPSTPTGGGDSKLPLIIGGVAAVVVLGFIVYSMKK